MENEPCLVELCPAQESELPEFRTRLQAAFAVAIVETFGPLEKSVPSDEEINDSLANPLSEALKVMHSGSWVGGAVVCIDPKTQENMLDLFFIDRADHSKGIGSAAWKAIEARYPKTRVWRLVTPYFEKRNIHFYANKCGFKIVEFYHSRHPCPYAPPTYSDQHSVPGCDESFLFEKVMG